MIKFNKHDLYKITTKSKAQSLINALRRHGLGSLEQNIITGGSRHGECDRIHHLLTFKTEDSINHFETKILNEKNNPYRQHNNMLVKSYENSINILKKIREL